MIDLELIHTVSIARRDESIASQELSFDANDAIASNVPCFIEPLAGSPMVVNPMGIGQKEFYDGLFLANTDILENDILTWVDPTDAVSKLLVVRSVDRVRDNITGPGLESHIDAGLQLREIDGT